jgi:hypothetical protein
VIRSARLYMGPIVLHVSLVLVLSAAALSHGIGPRAYAAITGAVALWGLARSLVVTAGIRGFRDPVPDWTDKYFYGLIPAALYVLLGAVAAGFWCAQEWAVLGVAGVIVALLLTCIRNEWDLVTWLAPRPDSAALTVAYHSACSLQHGQQVLRQPKELLSRAGFVVKDIAEAHLCCGSAGTYNIMQPDIAGKLRDRKVANIERVKPDVIAAGNIGCITQIGTGTDIPVLHTVELIDWATGGPVPESVKRMKRFEAIATRNEGHAAEPVH